MGKTKPLEVLLTDFSTNFRDSNMSVEDVFNYIQKTHIAPKLEKDMCIWVRSAYEQAHSFKVKDVSGYVSRGCYYCDGYLPKKFCQNYDPCLNPELYNNEV